MSRFRIRDIEENGQNGKVSIWRRNILVSQFKRPLRN